MEKWAPISEVPELKAALRGDDESEDAEETPPKTPDQEKKIVPKTAEEKKLHNAERRRMYRERQKTKRALGFATNVKRNVHVYISGLPRDEAVCSVEALVRDPTHAHAGRNIQTGWNSADGLDNTAAKSEIVH